MIPDSVLTYLDRLYDGRPFAPLAEVAHFLGISRKSLIRLVATGKIGCVTKLSTHRQFAKEQVLEYLKGRFECQYIPKDKYGRPRSPYYHYDFVLRVPGEPRSRRFAGSTKLWSTLITC